MKSKYLLIVFIASIFFINCKKEEKSLHNFMIGSWETTYIKIEYPSDTSSAPSIFEEKFEKPNTGRAQSKYNKNGTFTAWFKQPDGKKIGETTGNWKTKNDSLYVDYSYSGKTVKAWYQIKQDTNNFEGKVIYDWDDDGKFDDTLLMKAKRIKQ